MSQSTITTINIDKDVPLPAGRGKNGSTFNTAVGAALAKMSAGDSFVYSDETASGCQDAVVRYVAKKANVKVVIRKISDKDFRVWRIE